MRHIPHPPRLAEGLLRLFHTDRGEYTHLGDFAQVHRSLFEEKGCLTAWRWYWIQTIKTLPWIISSKIYWSWTMFKNYVKTALRNMFKNRGYSFINILGLAIGMAACLMIFLYVQDELSYDAHHKNADRIFRLAVDYKIRDQEAKIASSSAPAAEVILQ